MKTAKAPLKRSHKKKPAAPASDTLHEILSVGSGDTKRTEARIKRDIPLDREYSDDLKNVDAVSGWDKPAVAWYASYFEWQVADLWRWLSSVEKWAVGVLERAGIPIKKIPRALWSNVLSVTEKHGFQRGQHVQWHAAVVLKHLSILRANRFSESLDSPAVADAVAIAGIQLGALLREAEIRFGIFISRSQKGGAHPKNLPAVAAFVRSQIRKNPKLTASDLWQSIPSGIDGELKVGKAKLYVEKDLLRVMEKRNGEWRPIGELLYRSFQRYVTAARKAPAR